MGIFEAQLMIFRSSQLSYGSDNQPLVGGKFSVGLTNILEFFISI